jgi:DNA mismatch endonuclease (patch repair protein)
MADVFSLAKRSEVMSRIRGRGNRNTELRLIEVFRQSGISGWRRNMPVFGRPDFVFPKQHVAVFVDGCFWHGCDKHYNVPKGNAEFWSRKLQQNRARDRLVNRTLRGRGWTVVRIWEHSLKKNASQIASRVKRAIGKSAD